MKYLLVAIINTIYGILLLLTLSSETPGFFLVLTIGTILTILGLSGFVIWLRSTIKASHDGDTDESGLKNWFGLVKSFDLVLIIGLLFRAIIIQPYVVEGISMEPNFHDREIVLVDKISYRFREPSRGEIVIFQAPNSPSDDYIKRIIGLPGETVAITSGKVFINGKLVEEDYLTSGVKTLTDTSGIYRKTLGQNEYFVLGDNRNNSSDSREWGVLPRMNLIGRAWLVVYPFNNKGLVKFPAPEIKSDIDLSNFSLLNPNQVLKYL